MIFMWVVTAFFCVLLVAGIYFGRFVDLVLNAGGISTLPY